MRSRAGRRAPTFWLPLSLAPATVASGPPASGPGSAGPESIRVVARLRAGVPVARLERELQSVTENVRREAADGGRVGADFAVRVAPAAEELVAGRTRRALLVLLGAVGLVLLAACANVANLLLGRGAARAHELALRATLGASRWRLVRQLMAESLMLAIASGVVGLALGRLTLGALVRMHAANLPTLDRVRLDPIVLAYAFGLALATSLVFGLVPAVQMSAARPRRTLVRSEPRARRGGGPPHLRRSLVAAEMAIAVVLLVGAGLLVRSVVYLQHVDLGFEPDGLVAVHVALPRARYRTAASRDLFAEQMLERVRKLPAVAAATQTFSEPPHAVMVGAPLSVRGRAPDAAGVPFAIDYVGPDYFRVLRAPLRAGRTFTEAERRSGRAVIVNEAAARRFWPAGAALGGQVAAPGNANGAEAAASDAWATVVGVVGDVPVGGLTRDLHTPEIYFPYRAAVVPTFFGRLPDLVLLVRAAADPAPVISAVRAAAHALDPEVAIAETDLVASELGQSIAEPRFDMALLATFAVVALTLAAVGLAAVMGYAVTERTREIGVRMALGADEANVLRLVLREGAGAAALGVLLGLGGALAGRRLLSGLLYGIAPTDPFALVAGPVVLLVVAGAAAWWPARRAMRVDPVEALRAE